MKTNDQTINEQNALAGRHAVGRRSCGASGGVTRGRWFGRSLTLPCVLLLLCLSAHAQVNSGSTGVDGAFNPTTNTVINMADHPDGIYHYTSVNIPAGVTVSFIPNAGNKPVVWLVQGSCVINGTINIFGQNPNGKAGGVGGVGGFAGGTGQLGPETLPTAGHGPGGGKVTAGQNRHGGSASFGTAGGQITSGHNQFSPGDTYGNIFLLPLIGGSGGGGGSNNPEGGAQGGSGGGGGGGAMLIASSTTIDMNGSIAAYGGSGNDTNRGGGGGSGGGVRLVATTVRGGGGINCGGGSMYTYYNGNISSGAGSGRIRIDAQSDSFSGGGSGVITRETLI